MTYEFCDTDGGGMDGLSAYQIWLMLGNSGSQQDFIDSLRGMQGERGDPGMDGAPGTNGADGADGASAYQVWLNQGNSGTVDEYLMSLRGMDGTDGLSSRAEMVRFDPPNTITLTEQSLVTQAGVWSDWTEVFRFTLTEAVVTMITANLYMIVSPVSTGQGDRVWVRYRIRTDPGDTPVRPIAHAVQYIRNNNGIVASGISAVEVSSVVNAMANQAVIIEASIQVQNVVNSRTYNFLPNDQNFRIIRHITTTATAGQDGMDGMDGASAYQIWLNAGNSGTMQDFLDSLVGPAGAMGAMGAAGRDGTDGIDGTDGADGDSAYQIWLDNGNHGTMQDFLDSLVGMDGADGTNGLSAYQIWLNDGNTGSVEDFLMSLQGAMGQQGMQGPAGPAGADGADGANGLNAFELWQQSNPGGTMAQYMAAFTGPRGAMGAMGLKGDTGEQGPRGLQGATGPRGVSAQPTITNPNPTGDINLPLPLTGDTFSDWTTIHTITNTTAGTAILVCNLHGVIIPTSVSVNDQYYVQYRMQRTSATEPQTVFDSLQVYARNTTDLTSTGTIIDQLVFMSPATTNDTFTIQARVRAQNGAGLAGRNIDYVHTVNRYTLLLFS